MKSPVVKRSIVVAGHKTSVSLEEAFWNGMKEISGLRNMTLSELVGEIDRRDLRDQGREDRQRDREEPPQGAERHAGMLCPPVVRPHHPDGPTQCWAKATT